MIARRAGLALCALSLAACDNLLGLHDIIPDGEPVGMQIVVTSKGTPQQPLGLIAVTILNVQNQAVVGFTGEVKLAFGNNPSGAVLLGTVTATASGGVAQFDLVGIDKIGSGYTLVASTDGLPSATSGPIDVAPPLFVPIPTGIPGAYIQSIAISPAAAGGTATLFAGAGDGVYKSVDGGANWKSASFGADISARLVADLSRPGVIYHGHGGSFVPYFFKKTVDGGATWHNVAVGNNQLSYAYYIAVDPQNPSVIYASGSTPHRSNDGGTNWTTLGQSGCTQLAVDPVAVDTVYCLAYDGRTGQQIGLLRSTNGGMNWSPSTTGLTSMNLSMLSATPKGVFISDSGTLSRSTNAGVSWASLPIMFPSTLAYAPSNPDRVYLSQGSVILVSNDGGSTFNTAGTASDFIQSMTVDPTNPDVVYGAGNSLGVFLSTNAGATWSSASKGIDAHQISSVVMAPGAPGTVLASFRGTVLRTTNGGVSWTTAAAVEATAHLDPVVRTRMYLCGNSYFATSNNSGTTFSNGTASGLGGQCNRVLVAGATLFAVASGRLWKSTNAGVNWTDLAVGGANVFVYDAALGDAIGNVVVAGAGNAIFRSTNGGTSFAKVSDGYAFNLIADPKAPANIVMSGQECGIRRSTDGGATFGPVIDGPCQQSLGASATALYSSGRGSTADTVNETVLRTSTDGGAQWTPVEVSGIAPGITVSEIAASDDGKTFYLGTSAGLFSNAGR